MEIRAEISVLWNPYDDEGRIRVLDAKGLTECESSRNDEAVVERWRGKALRLLVRRIPQSAQEIVEARVAVVGNVVSAVRWAEGRGSRAEWICGQDAGKSSLLGGTWL